MRVRSGLFVRILCLSLVGDLCLVTSVSVDGVGDLLPPSVRQLDVVLPCGHLVRALLLVAVVVLAVVVLHLVESHIT